MNRNMKTIMQVAGIIGVILICAAIMYFGLAKPLGQGYIVGSKVKIQQWMAAYKSVVLFVTGFSIFISMLWYVAARFIFKITNSINVGKRAVWGVLFVLSIAGVIVITWAVGNITKGISLYLVHLLLFSVIGYYLTSVLFAPAAYKYTPLGAEMLRKRRN